MLDFIEDSLRIFPKSPYHYADCWKKNANFDFDESCGTAFEEIKSRLVLAPIMLTPDWSNEFEIMCDAIDYAMGVVLGQRIEKVFKAIYYASKTFNEAQENYSTIEKEMLAMVFAY